MMQWTDSEGTLWDVDLPPRGIVLRSGDKVIDLPADAWPRDLYVAPHDGGFLVRFDTFNVSAGFLLSARQAEPFLRHVSQVPVAFTEAARAAPEPSAEAPLLWPKVSPLAVWALIASSLVFLPVIGLIPATVTVTLLILHRRRVRRSRAWSHSRALCMAAVVFLVAGLCVSLLSTRGLMVNMAQGELGIRADVVDRPPRLEGPCRPLPDRSALLLQTTEDVAPAAGRNWGLIVAALFVVLLSLTVHEAAHATTAWWLGDDFARRLGRVTLNPLAHVDPLGTVVLPLLLFLAGSGVFGWAKPVPVRLDYVDRPRRAHVLIALAGPGSNLLLAMGSLLLLLGLGCVVEFIGPHVSLTHFSDMNLTETVRATGFALAPFVGAACTIFKLAFIVNVLLAFFNLIPIPPLDGSWVLENLFPFSLGRFYAAIRPFSFLLFLGLMYSNVLVYLMLPALVVLAPGILLLQLCTPFG